MANDIKQVLDIRPGKGMSVGQSDEHQRNWTEKGWDWATKHGNYDRSREHLNFEVVKGGIIQPLISQGLSPDVWPIICVSVASQTRMRNYANRSTAPWRTSYLALQGEDARNSLWQPKGGPHARG